MIDFSFFLIALSSLPHLINFSTQHQHQEWKRKSKPLGSPQSEPYKMTKNYRVQEPKKQEPKKQESKKPSFIANAAEEFPSPPKKDGTADPENIQAKRRREEAEAKQGGNKGGSSSSGGKKA